MATKDRSKELWLIPKRTNLHQSICLIDGILARNYDGTAWNESKQNNLGVNLKNWGATNSGKNISSQAIRTLVASIPQYLGFVYINTKLSTSTINITKAGRQLHDYHKNSLIRLINLKESDSLTIKESPIVLKQLQKLQLTNPIVSKDCENILVFPFIVTLKLLLELVYLDKEEIAYFVLRIKDESEVDLTIQEIKNFRKLSIVDRSLIIEKYKETHIGNITLVQAPSSAYFMSLCEISGLVTKTSESPDNRLESINGIRIKSSMKKIAEDIVKNKYSSVLPYNFEHDLPLWIDYIGNPAHEFPPFDMEFSSISPSKIIVSVVSNDRLIGADELSFGEKMLVPLFDNDEYEITIYDSKSGRKISTNTYKADKSNQKQLLISQSSAAKLTIDDLISETINHISSQYFSDDFTNKLNLLNTVFGIDRLTDKSLRGAYLEKLIFDILRELEKTGIIYDLVWNGGVKQFGLPSPAPGGKYGEADIIFKQNDTTFVLELTTIKAKALQHSAEGASVPDHIIRYKNNHPSEKVVGIFSAPVMHERVNAPIKTIVNEKNIDVAFVTIVDLLAIIKRGNIVDSITKAIASY